MNCLPDRMCRILLIIQSNNTTLIDELIPKLHQYWLKCRKFSRTFCVREYPIRDLLTILETLADHASVTRDTDVLTEYVRQSLKRAISSKFFAPNEVTSVVTLDPAIEQEIMNSVKQTEQGAYISLDPDKTQKIVKQPKKK